MEDTDMKQWEMDLNGNEKLQGALVEITLVEQEEMTKKRNNNSNKLNNFQKSTTITTMMLCEDEE